MSLSVPENHGTAMRRYSFSPDILMVSGCLLLSTMAGCVGGRAAEDLPNGVPALSSEETVVNMPTATEDAQGWRLLFDGSLSGWRGYQMDQAPDGWSGDGQVLAFTPGKGGGDLITVDQFEDFELAFEWKLSPGGNSGVFFRVTEEGKYPYWTGPEMQILDNMGHADGQSPLTSAGANYGLHAPSEDVTRPPGEWNEARIVVRGPKVEHWMNGVQIVMYELGTDAWSSMVAETKFAEWPGYGMADRGHIALQDHGDPVWYRNIKIREL